MIVQLDDRWGRGVPNDEELNDEDLNDEDLNDEELNDEELNDEELNDEVQQTETTEAVSRMRDGLRRMRLAISPR